MLRCEFSCVFVRSIMTDDGNCQRESSPYRHIASAISLKGAKRRYTLHATTTCARRDGACIPATRTTTAVKSFVGGFTCMYAFSLYYDSVFTHVNLIFLIQSIIVRCDDSFLGRVNVAVADVTEVVDPHHDLHTMLRETTAFLFSRWKLKKLSVQMMSFDCTRQSWSRVWHNNHTVLVPRSTFTQGKSMKPTALRVKLVTNRHLFVQRISRTPEIQNSGQPHGHNAKS